MTDYYSKAIEWKLQNIFHFGLLNKFSLIFLQQIFQCTPNLFNSKSFGNFEQICKLQVVPVFLRKMNRKYAKYGLTPISFFTELDLLYLTVTVEAFIYYICNITQLYYFYSSDFKPKPIFPRKIFFFFFSSAFSSSLLTTGLLSSPTLGPQKQRILRFSYSSYI